MKNIISLSCKLQLRKKTTILNIIFITLTIILVLGFYSYLASSINYLENDMYNVYYFKMLQVAKVNNTEEDAIYTEEEKEKMEEELSEIDHVTNVSYIYAYYTSMTIDELMVNNLTGSINVYTATNESLPLIVYGSDFPDEDANYMICPENFYPTGDLDNATFLNVTQKINIEDYLNTKITYNYTSAYGTNEYSTEFTIVGFYKNNSTHTDENVCYITNKAMQEIAVNRYSDDIDPVTGINNIELQTSYVIEVDELENVDAVMDTLSEMGYRSSAMAYATYEVFEQIENTMIRNATIVLFISFIILLIISLKQTLEDKNNYMMFNNLGYKKKTIAFIFILSNLIQLILSLIVSLIFMFIAITVFKVLLNYYPFLLDKMTLCIDYYSIVKVFLIIFASMIISILLGLGIIKGVLNENNNI